MKLKDLLNPVTRTARSDSSDSALPQTEHESIGPNPDAYYCRVPKACTHCRREKSRCELSRPCHNCVKRNRSKECVDGCYPCRQMKKICTNSWPCPSCIESDLECVFTPPPVKKQQPRKKGGRSKRLRCDKTRCETGRPCAHCKRKIERSDRESKQYDRSVIGQSTYSDVSRGYEDRDDALAKREEDDNTSISPVTPMASLGTLSFDNPEMLFNYSSSPSFTNSYRSPLYIRAFSKSPVQSDFPDGSPTLAMTTSSMRSTQLF